MMNSTMVFLLYGVAATGIIVSFGYRFMRKRGQSKPKNEAMNKISDFYAMQDQEHNY